jgi:hypothetical protein
VISSAVYRTAPGARTGAAAAVLQGDVAGETAGDGGSGSGSAGPGAGPAAGSASPGEATTSGLGGDVLPVVAPIAGATTP